MDDAARVLADCAANPDDDAPRLVWADLVGGERGELVVLQCDLARGELAPAEVAARRRRERELLAAHGVAWAGALANVATWWSFERGFVAAAAIDATELGALARIARDHPLLDAVTLDVDAGVPAGPLPLAGLALRGLHVHAPGADPAFVRHVYADDQLRGLRAFGATDARDADAVHAIVRANPLAQLWLDASPLVRGDLAAILAAAPHLDALSCRGAVDESGFTEDLLRLPLRALRVSWLDDDHLAAIARSRLGGTLEHLVTGLRSHGDAPVLPPLPGLHTLEVEGDSWTAMLRALGELDAPALRVLRVRAPLASETLDALTATLGPQLELLELPVHRAPVRPEVRARVAGELRTGAELTARHAARTLLHAHAGFALAPACTRRTPPISFVRLDGGDVRIWDFPPRPVADVILLGRNGDGDLVLRTSTTSRRHARIVWRDGADHAEDMETTSGLYVNGQRVHTRRLADGDELTLGAARVRYFIGPGAANRARDALAGS